jgi:microcystin-dependent protein
MFIDDVFASRPAAGSTAAGTFFRATDTGAVYICTGAAWVEISTGAAVPIGGSLDYAGSTDPADTRFLLEDGRAISRATYAAAFAIMGTTYGPGNGTTTFNIPDSRGRGSVAPDDMGTAAGAAGRMASNKTLGAVGGTETKTLAEANLPAHVHDDGTLANSTTGSHDHTVGTLVNSTTSGGTPAGSVTVNNAGTIATGTQTAFHAHTYSRPNMSTINEGTAGTTPAAVSVSSVATGNDTPNHAHIVPAHGHTASFAGSALAAHGHTISGSVASNGDHTHTISGNTGSIGSGTAFNNMPPYLVKNKIIRVL